MQRKVRRTNFPMIRQNLAKIQMAMLPTTDGAISLSDIVILDDNLTEDAPAPPKADVSLKEVIHETPFKQMICFLLICKSGRMVFRINLKEYEIGPNDAILCYPGMIMDSMQVSRDVQGAMIAFAHEVFFPDGSNPSIKVLRRNMITPQIFHLDEKRAGMLITSYNLLKSTLQKEKFDFKKDVIGGGLQIIAAMLAQWTVSTRSAIPDSPKNRDEGLFINFITDVQRNCVNQRKISYYAEKFCISPKYFARLIYNVSGRHPSQWIRDYVIMEAKVMLRSGSYTVQQVSDALHFPNSSFFGKYFKAAVGMSPRTYMIESR